MARGQELYTRGDAVLEEPHFRPYVTWLLLSGCLENA